MQLRRLFSYWPSAKKEIAPGGLLLVLAAGMELLQPWPIKWLVDYAFGSRTAPPWLKTLWPSFATGDIAGEITSICISILVLAVVYRTMLALGHFFLVRAGARIVQQLRLDAYEQLHRLSLAFHDRTKIGDSLYRVAYDTHAAQGLINGALVPMLNGTLLVIGVAIVMLRVNPLLTVVTMAAAPMLFTVIRGFSRKVDEQSRHYHENESALVSSVQESLSSIRVIQAFTLEPQASERFRAQAEGSLEANQRMIRVQLLYSACAGFALSLCTAAVVWVAGHQIMRGRLSLGDVLVFLAYLGMLYQPMSTFSQSASIIQSSGAQLRRVFEIIDAVPEIKDSPKARTLPAVRGDIEFRAVSFEYDKARAVLKDVNLKIASGKVVALVGRTGAGKTTLASLVPRFYDPTRGAILLDGTDLRDLRVGWLRSQVSVVMQDPVLFSATVADNIGYGRPGAALAEIQEAARLAQADEFIGQLPQGYQTILGERGVNLSGGQRQRVSIARAFLKNAPILILDEPTSALDTQTEEALLASMRELMRGRTTLVIAHRLSIAQRADVIVVLDQGRIVEHGSHVELLARDTEYKRMYESQWGQAM